jgi:hypothetical protein
MIFIMTKEIFRCILTTIISSSLLSFWIYVVPVFAFLVFGIGASASSADIIVYFPPLSLFLHVLLLFFLQSRKLIFFSKLCIIINIVLSVMILYYFQKWFFLLFTKSLLSCFCKFYLVPLSVSSLTT